MTEKDEYLSSILGDGALAIQTFTIGEKTYGDFNRIETIDPITDVRFQDERILSLKVKPEHLSGHFAGPATLPAYRMLELGAMTGKGQKIAGIHNAQFNKIIKPDDCIMAFSNAKNEVVITRRQNGNMQEIACATMDFDDIGLDPFEAGIMLEIASQTIVSNIIKSYSENGTIRYPVILSMEKMSVLDTSLTQHLNVIPSLINKLDDKGNYLASANIKSDYNRTVATVDDIVLKLATEREIELYDALGRNY